MARPKGSPKIGGRKPGSLNKTTTALKEAILAAADAAGGPDGLTGYLLAQARLDNPTAFMGLLGKVLPHQIAGDKDNPLAIDAQLKSDDGFKTLCSALEIAASAARRDNTSKG